MFDHGRRQAQVSGACGAASQISAGATIISNKCCAMWTDSSKSAKGSSGDAIASSTAASPPKNAASCAGPKWGDPRRLRIRQPRA